jgi:tRNA (guanine37-N1)-methyltransferase
MRVDIFSLLPEVMTPYLQASVLGKAQVAGLLQVELHNIRDYTNDRHRTTDDEPFGGGGGMVMKPEPIFAAVESVLGEELGQIPLILLSPQGAPFTQAMARRLARQPRLALIAGRYEGVDERVRLHLVNEELSIGDYVLTGGELPALVVVDAVARCLPGVLGDEGAAERDSHASGLLEGPHYTRPATFRTWEVPPVLRSGDHAQVAGWRREQALRRTQERRPDLLERAELSDHDLDFLAGLAGEEHV